MNLFGHWYKFLLESCTRCGEKRTTVCTVVQSLVGLVPWPLAAVSQDISSSVVIHPSSIFSNWPALAIARKTSRMAVCEPNRVSREATATSNTAFAARSWCCAVPTLTELFYLAVVQHILQSTACAPWIPTALNAFPWPWSPLSMCLSDPTIHFMPWRLAAIPLCSAPAFTRCMPLVSLIQIPQLPHAILQVNRVWTAMHWTWSLLYALSRTTELSMPASAYIHILYIHTYCNEASETLRPCLDTKFTSQISLCKKKIPITSKCRHMHGVQNRDEIKN
jgi:hypothetical protein